MGSILSAKPKGPLFYAGVDVRIGDSASGEQHSVAGTRVRPGKDQDPNDPAVMEAMQRLAADDLSRKIAGLMP